MTKELKNKMTDYHYDMQRRDGKAIIYIKMILLHQN